MASRIVWGRKPRHHVAGVVDGCRFRGVVDGGGKGRVVVLGQAWNPTARTCSERRAEVVIEAEGPPQRGDLAFDVAAALSEVRMMVRV